MSETKNILFICTGNSARSIMAEAITNHMSDGRFKAYSAGSSPKGAIQPHAIATLIEMGISIEGLRSKSWDEFSSPGISDFDFVFTLCDQTANEPCPVWPGQPLCAHWGMADPAAMTGSPEAISAQYKLAATLISSCVKILFDLPIETLDRFTLQKAIEEIRLKAAN
jgi:arsenate reductase (thioredoxin)